MNPLASLRVECRQILWDAIEIAYPGVELPELKYSFPPNPKMGDISLAVCFHLARSLKQAPDKIAEEIVKIIKISDSKLIKEVKALNGYINFYVDPSSFGKIVLEAASYDDYGYLETDEPETIIVEHTSANPNAPLHIGNARNAIIGDSLANLLEYQGNKVLRHFLVNDMGRQIAMTTFGWKLLNKPEPEGRAEEWVGAIYASVNVVSELVRVSREYKEAEESGKVAKIVELQEERIKYETAAKELRSKYPKIYNTLEKKIPQLEDPESLIAVYNTSYENKEPETVNEIRRIVGYCLNGFETSLGEIQIGFDSFDFESDLVWDKAADTVLEKLKKTPYVFEDDGVLVLDCNKIALELKLKKRWELHPQHEIPRLVLVRSDGTTLYTLRDIAYSIWKFQRADRVINVIGTEQQLAQIQLRLALAALGNIWMGDNQYHYAYEFVFLPGVKMAGRLGRYITLVEVLQKAVELAYQEVDQRTPHLSTGEKEEIAKMVGYGAVKYTILSVDARKTVTFDWKKALNFDINSAPFIQYSHARACNILKRVDMIEEPDYGMLVNIKEIDLIMTIAKFPEVFEGAVSELKPGDITAYVNLLADKFNSYYAAIPVLKANNEKLKNARLMLVEALRRTIYNALQVLGIQAPERM